MLTRVKEVLGLMWGKTTTIVLSVGVVVVSASALPEVQPLFELWPGARRGIAILGAIVGILRFVTPPPPSVSINTGDAVVRESDNVVTIVKAEALPDKIADKAPGEKV